MPQVYRLLIVLLSKSLLFAFHLPAHSTSSLRLHLYQNQYTRKSPSPSDVDVKELLQRIDRLESQVKYSKPIDPVQSWFGAWHLNMMELSAQSVEICSIISMSFIGCILGWSLLDRFWLISGVLSGWWASGAVHRSMLIISPTCIPEPSRYTRRTLLS